MIEHIKDHNKDEDPGQVQCMTNEDVSSLKSKNDAADMLSNMERDGEISDD